MKLIKELGLESFPKDKLATARLRRAVRAIVYDADHNIALLHVSNLGYYKLPGGGIEDGENVIDALKRECLEEIGCEIETEEELGMTIEFRAEHDLKQESFFYTAHVVGEKGEPSLTEVEHGMGFKTVWVSLEEAISLGEKSRTDDYQGRFVVPRDFTVLRELQSKKDFENGDNGDQRPNNV